MAGLPISIGSVGVKIVPDMRGFDTKIDAFTKTLRDINLGIDVDSLAAETKLATVTEMVDRLDGHDVDINVDVNREGLAASELALTDLTASIDNLIGALDGAGGGLTGAGAAAGGSAGGFSLLGAAILGVIALAGPITAVLIPALFGLATVVASVTAGIGVFVVAFIPLAKAVEAFRKAQLDPTTANLQALQKTLVGMPGAGRGLVLFIGTKLWPAFQKIQRAAERGLFPGLLKGLKAVMPLVQPLTRFVGSLARTLGDLAASAGRALNDKFWRGFFAFVTATAGPTLKTFAQIIGEVAHGLASMSEGFGPLVKRIGSALLALSESFANWAAGKGFQNFLSYVETNGPQLLKTLTDLARLGLKLILAFTPLAPVLLKLVDAVTRLLDKLSPSELLLIVAALGLLVGGFTGVAVAVVAAAGLIISNWDRIKSFFEGIGHWFSGPFVNFFKRMNSDVMSLGDKMRGSLIGAWNGIKSAAAAVGHWFTGPFVGFFTSMGHKIHDAWDHVVSFMRSIPGKIKGFFKGAGTWLVKAGEAILGGLLTGLKSAWHHVTGFVSGIGGWISSNKGPIDVDRVMLVPHGQAIMQGLADGMKHKWPSVQDVVHAAGASIPQQMADGIASTTPAMTGAMQHLNDALKKELDNLKSTLTSLRSDKKSLADSISSSLGGFDLTQATKTVTTTSSGLPVYYNYPGEGSGFYIPPDSTSTRTVTTAGSLVDYLEKYQNQEFNVIRLLGKLGHGKLHLSKGEVSQFEQMPVSESLPILRALRQASAGQFRTILSDMASIHELGTAAGRDQSQQVYDPQIKTVVDRLDKIEKQLHHIGSDTADALNGMSKTAKHKGTARRSS